MRVRPSFWPSHMYAVVMYSPLASVREYAVPPVPPWEKLAPLDKVKETASILEAPRMVTVDRTGLEGRLGRSVNQSPWGPPKRSLWRRVLESE